MSGPMTKESAEAYLEMQGFKLLIDTVKIRVPKHRATFSPEESAAIDFLIRYFSDQGITMNFQYQKA